MERPFQSSMAYAFGELDPLTADCCLIGKAIGYRGNDCGCGGGAAYMQSTSFGHNAVSIQGFLILDASPLLRDHWSQIRMRISRPHLTY